MGGGRADRSGAAATGALVDSRGDPRGPGLILLNPVRVEESPGTVERPKVAYLVDASQSMALGQGEGASRWDRTLATIRDAESARGGDTGPKVGVFRFGGRLEAVDPAPWGRPGPDRVAPPGPTDPDTLVAGSLETLAARLGREPPRAVVVFSDGRARDAERAPAIARGFGRMKVPIHVVPVGDENSGGDVAIVSMVAPNLVRKSTRVAAQVFVRSHGYKGRRAELKLAVVGPDGRPGALLARTPVTLGDGLSSYILPFETGEADRKIVATVDTQPGEVSATNNSFEAAVAIDHTKIRVLYLEGSNEQYVTRRGLFGLGQGEVQGAYSPLYQALREDPDVECTAVISTGDAGNFTEATRSDDRGRGLPETPSELFAYDAIVLSNVSREALGDKYMGWVEEWVGRRGGGLCMVGGPNSFGSGRWAGTPIGAMLPVEVESGGRDWDEAPATIAPAVDAAIHPLWHIAADDAENRALLKTLPPFLGHNRLGPVKPTAETLARIGDDPAVAAQPYGRGRTLAFAAGITRKLAPGFSTGWGQEGDARYYKKFWRNAAYWLTENSSIGRRRLLAETDKRLYRPGEPIVLKARAFDENAGPTLDYRVAVSVEPRSAADASSDNSPLRRPSAGSEAARGPLLPWGEEFNLSKIAAEKTYTAALPIAAGKDFPAGVASTLGLRIELTAYENNTQVDSTAVDVQVLDDPTEQQDPLPDHDLLKRIAAESGGSVLKGSADLAAMLGRLPVAVGPPDVKARPAWSRGWLLATLIALLTVEWAWRRRIGLA